MWLGLNWPWKQSVSCWVVLQHVGSIDIECSLRMGLEVGIAGGGGINACYVFV